MINYYNIYEIKEEFENMKCEALNWERANYGNYSCLMLDLETKEIWLDVYTQSNWGE